MTYKEANGLPEGTYPEANGLPIGFDKRFTLTNERTYGLTNDLQDQGSNRPVPNTSRAVDKRFIVLSLAPIGLKQATEYVIRVHRHHGKTTGHKFSNAVIDAAGAIHGVGIAGRPVSRHLQAQGSLEVLRVASDGTPNVCSMIYGAMRLAARGMGYKPWQCVTYTLESELGASLLAAGWIRDGWTPGGTWSRDDRPRDDKHPLEAKGRWIAGPRPICAEEKTA